VCGAFYENKRRGVINDDNGNTKKKRRKSLHDHERAWQHLRHDYLGPEPMFTDKQFEEAFQLAKSKVEMLMQVRCQHNPKTFCPGPDATGKPGIQPEVKVLGILKCVAFGCSSVTKWQDV